MQTKSLPLLLAVSLSSCVRPAYPPPVPVENDTSIRFPRFFDQVPITIGSKGGSYELDGVTLRALAIAANDYLPPGGKNRPCEYTQEAQRYAILRQGNIIFISISEDSHYCGFPSPAMDSGVRYAISTDGRILRRLFEGQPEGPPEPIDFNDGSWGPPSRPGIDPEFDARWNRPDAGPVPPPESTSVPDAGSSGAP
jgi:hypothetical protein